MLQLVSVTMKPTSSSRRSRSASRRQQRKTPKGSSDKAKNLPYQKSIAESPSRTKRIDKGIKLSKNAIIELLETNIKKAHTCTQKAMLNFYCVILKLMSTLFTLWDNKVPAKASIKQTVVDSSSSNKIIDPKTPTNEKSSIESYQTRLDEKLAKIQQHKSRLNGDRLTESAPDATLPTSKPTPNTTDLSCLRTSQLTSSASSLKLLQPKRILNKSKFQEYCLVLCVHAGLVVMYLQVVILGMALNTTSIPSGLIFLLATVGIIGYIFLKVSLMETQPHSTKSPKSSTLPKVKGASRDLIKDDFSPERQSRSKAKKLQLAIEMKYKTLSKVKLL